MNAAASTLYAGVVDPAGFEPDGGINVRIPALGGVFPCRMLVPMAGKGRGLVFLPEIGDQVVVASVFGADVEFVLVGGLWSPNEAPLELADATNNDIKLIQTKGGNLIRMIDTSGHESIEISTPHGQRILLSPKENSVLIKGNVTIEGKLKVNNGSTGTTIDGNTIKGGECRN